MSRLYGLRKTLWNKDRFCETMNFAKRGLPETYKTDFVFDCWNLPKDYDDLIQKATTKYADSTWIVKPTNRGEGSGIVVMDDAEHLKKWKEQFEAIDEVVVQQYMPNPMLINGKKWDLRTYILVTSTNPLRAYMFRDGLTRFATSKFDPNAKGGGKRTAFLTNTSINKKTGAKVDDLTWPFPKLRAHFESIGQPWEKILRKIEATIVQTLLSAEPSFSRMYRHLKPDFTCAVCYQLLGVDVIMDDQYVPKVIEINGEPSMQLSGDKRSHYDATKKAMSRDLVELVFNRDSHARALTSDLSELEFDGFNVGYKKLGCKGGEKICLKPHEVEYLLDSKREAANVGGFRRIYPSARGNDYDTYVKHLQKRMPHGAKTSSGRMHALLTELEKRNPEASAIKDDNDK